MIDYIQCVTPNNGQAEFLEKGKKFLKDKTAKEFCLNGPGGTGKTTIIKELLKREDKNNKGNWYIPQSVIGVTVAHKARIVLEEHIKNSITYASAVNLMIDFDQWGEMIFVPKKGEFKQSKLYNYKYIVFDEASMIGEEMRIILQQSCHPGAKFIYMGDDCQLPPIKPRNGRYDADADSPVFSLPWQYTLTEKMRQNDDDIIARLGDTSREHIKGDQNLNWITRLKTEYNAAERKGFSRSHEEAVVKSYVSNFKEGINSRMVAYRNTRVDHLNHEVRMRLFPETYEERFVPGDLLVGNDQYTPENDTIFFNGEDLMIEGVERCKVLEVDCHQLWCKGKNMPVYVPSAEGMDLYNDRLAFLKRVAIQTHYWKDYMEFRSQYANVSYGHALTLYKVQGSTLYGVYVDVSDIFGVKPLTNKRKLQSFYVGVSRPTNFLAMF